MAVKVIQDTLYSTFFLLTSKSTDLLKALLDESKIEYNERIFDTDRSIDGLGSNLFVSYTVFPVRILTTVEPLIKDPLRKGRPPFFWTPFL